MINYEGQDKLAFWQGKLELNDSQWKDKYIEFDFREHLYMGCDKISPIVSNDEVFCTPHVRNIVSELIESQVSAAIPQPKVTAVHSKDIQKAQLIENMIRNELDRLPMEQLNDMMERTVPIQGGALWLVEWDEGQKKNGFLGDVFVSVLHPKQIVPQDGVYTSIEDMDYIFLKLPQTKSYIKQRYNVDVDMEMESEPDVKGTHDFSASEDMVTQYIVYFHEKEGKIGRFSWVNDIVLEDYGDYQAREVFKCPKCGFKKPLSDEKLCPNCGAGMKRSEEEFEEIFRTIVTPRGKVIPGADLNPLGEPAKIKYYKPASFPVILQKNISVFGQLLGESDVDKIKTQQNTTNRIEAKIIERLVKAGTAITLPEETYIDISPADQKVWRLKDMSQKSMIDTYEFSGNLQYEMAYLAQVYEEARQVIGITDSFQGRRDATATSKVSKEFAAQQSAGRLESKRVMKQAAWAALFEAIFKLKLAYADEPRPVVYKDLNGNDVYEQFSRYDFLEQDERGEWYYNDSFLFSCDTSAPLANNREALWQETRLNLESGAFGDRAQISTLILFWSKMEQYHYPGAGEVKKYLEEQNRRMMLDAQMQIERAQAQQYNADAQAASLQGAQGALDLAVMDALTGAETQNGV